MFTPIRTVEVRIWGKSVGAVALEPSLGYYAFEYQPAFVKTGIELAPLEMPLSAAHEPFVFPDLPELTYRRLPGILADALPDEFGNLLLAQHRRQPNGQFRIDQVQLLERSAQHFREEEAECGDATCHRPRSLTSAR